MEFVIAYIIGIGIWAAGSLLLQGYKLEDLNITDNIINSIFWLFNLLYFIGVLAALAYGIYKKDKDAE